MPSTTLSAAPAAADSRVARRRVGAAAIVAFLALLLAGAVRDAVGADPVVPASAPTTQPAQQTAPAQPQQQAPQEQQPEEQPQTAPATPSFPRERERGGGFGGGPGFGGRDAPDSGAPDSGGGTTPAVPSTTDGGVIA
jgi:hypothetical protein